MFVTYISFIGQLLREQMPTHIVISAHRGKLECLLIAESLVAVDIWHPCTLCACSSTENREMCGKSSSRGRTRRRKAVRFSSL